ncbi:hypothetical protein V6N12_047856 [Hibiscus sabdariffa]|uniref:Pollen-specific protein SF21 n=1 Tax=Hibiscus sabdariffa TaxID=183260 RepID=A0ABR2CWP7_9ROSI
MADSNDSVSIDIEMISLGGKEYLVKTRLGTVSVVVFGDQDKPALVTYPDLALNQILQLGIIPSVDDLADQIFEAWCRNVYGSYSGSIYSYPICDEVQTCPRVNTRFTHLQTAFMDRVVMSNLLYFYGMCGLVKELLLKRYFSKEVRGSVVVLESDIVQACRRLLDERQSINVCRFLEAMDERPDLSEGLRKLHCRSLIFVGENSPFHSEALHMTSKLDRRYSALVEVQACGSVVTEEQPHAMLIPIEYFLMGYGFYRPTLSISPRSPLSPSCISPQLLSPESMGLKLKPIKTRISL